MIKGVNRQIVEVEATANEYFERALLVVRPHCEDMGETRLQSEAQHFLDECGSYSALSRGKRQRLIGWLVCLSTGALLGAAVMFFVR